MIAGAFFFSLMSALVKLAGARLPALEIVLARAVVTSVLSWAALRRRAVPMLGRRRRLLVLRGILGFIALNAFYLAVIRLPLAEATVIHYMSPVFTALFAVWFIGERMSRTQVAFVFLSFAGVVVVARPGGLIGWGTPLDGIGVAAAICGAVFSGAAYVAVRRLSATEDPLVIVLYFSVLSVIGSAPFVALNPVMPTPREWLLLLGVGVATQLGQVFLTWGLRLEAAGRAMGVGYVQIVFAAGWGALLFGVWPDGWTVLGSLVVVVATIGLARARQHGELGSPGPSR